MATWNWSWVNSFETTNRASQSVDDSGGTLYIYRAPTRGHITAAELRSSLDSISTNINHLWRLWRSNIRPVLDSLPSGRRDTRWRTGRGLPEKIDALRYGIQGSTLFVFNDANSTKASGKYWHSTDERPITIAEAFEDLWDALNDIETTESTTPTSVDLSPLWYAIGNRYEDISYTSATTSLDYRTGVMENWWVQLQEDLYNPGSFPPYSLGVPLSYSVALNIDLLLKAHGITGGWQANPAGLGHGSFAPGSHTHPYTDILTTLTIGQTQARVAPLSTLADEVKRIRYEIARTRGGAATWYTDPVDPVTSTATGTLYTHMSYGGTGTKTAANPHGITSTDLGIDDYFQYIADYIGMSDYTLNIYPTYSSTNYITNGDDITIAIGKLDDAIDNVTGFVFKRIIDFTGRVGSDTELMQSPLVWEHNMGEYPVLQFIDLDAEEHESFGMYSSPTQEVQVDYPDINTVRIWTTATDIRIIGLFGGTTGGPSSGITEYVRSIKAETSGVALYGDVTLIGGSNVTLTRSGQNITIDASGGGGSGYWIESGTALIPYVSTHSVRFGPGLVGTPGLVFSNDTTTGIYRPGAGVLGISCAGSQAIYFSSSVINCTNRLGIMAGFYDSNKAGSTWSSAAISLSANSTEWDNLELLIGSEGSLFASILAAADLARGFTSGSILYAAADGSITENNSYMHYNPGLSATMTQHLLGTSSASSTIKVEAPDGTATQYIVADSSNTIGGTSTIYMQCTANSASDNLISLVSGVGGGIINTNGHMRFSNSHRTGWSQAYLLLSDDASDWTDYQYLFGEVSLMAAIVAAASSGGGGTTSLDIAYNNGSSITADAGAVTITVPDTSNNTVLSLIQNDTTNNPNCLSITNTTGGNAISLSGAGLLSIYSSASLSLIPTGNLTLAAGSLLAFNDTYKTGWSSNLHLSDSSSDWTDYKYLFGEVSLMAAIIAASAGTGVTSLDTAYNNGSNITVDAAAIIMTSPNASNNAVLSLVQNDTTNNPACLTIANAGGGDALSFSGSGLNSINSTASLSVLATGNLTLACGSYLSFNDGYKSGWSSNLHLSDSSSDWTDYEYLFGEVSLMAAIVAAASSGTIGLDDAYNIGSSITVDTAAITMTVPNTSNNAALSLVQDDVTNNPNCLTITNNAGGNAIYFSGSGLLAITSSASLSVLPTGNLTLACGSYLTFNDGYKSGWSGNLHLSDSSSDWTDYKYLFGEVSIMSAIIAAASSGSGLTSLDIAYNNGSSITADNGSVTITAPDNSDNACLTLTQNDITNYGPNALVINRNSIPSGPGNPWANAYSIFLTGYAEQTIWSDKKLYLGKTGSAGGYVWLLLDETASGGKGILNARDSSASHFANFEIGATTSASYAKIDADSIRFVDANISGWTQEYILLSDSSSDWTDYVYLFGEVSLMAAIIAAASSGSISETAGQILFGTGTGVTSESNLFWDATNNFLGITNNTPEVGLHVGTSSAIIASSSSDMVGSGLLEIQGDVFTDGWLGQATNTFIGYEVIGAGNLTHSSGDQGYYNTVLGYQGLYSITTGNANIAIGSSGLYGLTSGSYNSAIGTQALQGVTTGNANNGFGMRTLQNVNGIQNTAMGHLAGDNLTSGNYCLALGANADFANTTGDYQLVISNTIYGNTTSGFIGINKTNSTVGLQVGAGTPSFISANTDIYCTNIEVGTTIFANQFDNGDRTGWTQTHIKLSDDGTDWTDYQYLFGEVSIMAAIIAAASSGGSGSAPAGQLLFGTGAGTTSSSDLVWDTTYKLLALTNNRNGAWYNETDGPAIYLTGTATQGQVIFSDQNIILGNRRISNDAELNLFCNSEGAGNSSEINITTSSSLDTGVITISSSLPCYIKASSGYSSPYIHEIDSHINYAESVGQIRLRLLSSTDFQIVLRAQDVYFGYYDTAYYSSYYEELTFTKDYEYGISDWTGVHAATITLDGSATQGSVIRSDNEFTIGAYNSSDTATTLNLIAQKGTGGTADSILNIGAYTPAGSSSTPEVNIIAANTSSSPTTYGSIQTTITGGETQVFIEAINSSSSDSLIYLNSASTSGTGAIEFEADEIVFTANNFVDFNNNPVTNLKVVDYGSSYNNTVGSNAFTFSPDNGVGQRVTITADSTWVLTTPAFTGCTRTTLWIYNSDSSGHTLTLGSGSGTVNWFGGETDGFTVAASSYAIVTVIYDTTLSWAIGVSLEYI